MTAPASLRRRWRCCLCPVTGEGTNEEDAWARLGRHYRVKHMKHSER